MAHELGKLFKGITRIVGEPDGNNLFHAYAALLSLEMLKGYTLIYRGKRTKVYMKVNFCQRNFSFLFLQAQVGYKLVLALSHRLFNSGAVKAKSCQNISSARFTGALLEYAALAHGSLDTAREAGATDILTTLCFHRAAAQ